MLRSFYFPIFIFANFLISSVSYSTPPRELSFEKNLFNVEASKLRGKCLGFQLEEGSFSQGSFRNESSVTNVNKKDRKKFRATLKVLPSCGSNVFLCCCEEDTLII